MTRTLSKPTRDRLLRLASLLDRAAARLRAFIRARTPKRKLRAKETA